LADTGEGAVESRVLATFLTEMDGVDANGAGGVIVIGTTNRIDNIDAALLRKVFVYYCLYLFITFAFIMIMY
jgi:SpoVK/Ycf46/Vps4 family AAA+-type ATPase